MSDNPFEDEEARREALFQEVTFEDLHELQVEDIEKGKAAHQKDLDELEKDAKQAKARFDAVTVVKEKIKEVLGDNKIIPTYTDWEAEERERRRGPETIGGWNLRNDRPFAERDPKEATLRFEIEADRALFLGKPVPTDPELAAKHQKLAELHARYQTTSDPSLLIGIADMQAEYQTMLDTWTRAKRKGR